MRLGKQQLGLMAIAVLLAWPAGVVRLAMGAAEPQASATTPSADSQQGSAAAESPGQRRAGPAVERGGLGGFGRRQPPATASSPRALPPLSAPDQQAALPRLTKPAANGQSSGDLSIGLTSLFTAASGLAIVIGLFLAVAWLMRRTAPANLAVLPKEVVEVLGRVPLGHQHHMQLVRFGNKLLLLSVTTAGAETLAEITDVDEVTRLAGLCGQGQPGSASQVFRQVFQQLASQRKMGAEP